MKTKIVKILPFWLIGLLLIITIKIGVPVILPIQASGRAIQSPVAAQPQVLGASTSIRGDLPTPQRQLTEISNSDLSAVTAKSFLVFDLANGQELLAKNPSQKLEIASLTKLMTGLVAYKNSNLDNSFILSSADQLKVSPDLGLLPGDEVKPLDLFNAMLIGSCNDAAKAIADYTKRSSGQDFIGLMNQQAKILGMDDSSFGNPMGFDSPYNYSTAEDLKILITATQQLSAFTDLGRREDYEFSGSLGKEYSTVATDILIKDHPDIEAVKTGFTSGAEGAMATKIDFNGHEIIILVLGSQDREADTLKLKAVLEQDFQ